MCGIVAIVSRERPIDPRIVPSALSALEHRGPDQRGEWSAGDGRAALGHVRLSIVDLERGVQPMANEDGTVHLVVNGELYDSDRLREELEGRGHRFRSRSDSEVALHLYEELGTDCLRCLVGEFAFALWDDRTRTIFAARDRFGIKPLFYAEHEGRVLLASEIKALLAAGVPAAWDQDGVFRALHFSSGSGATLYRGIRQVPPGHFALVRNGRLQLHEYWEPGYPVRTGRVEERSEVEIVHAVDTRLQQAVRTRLRSDVPIACYLSGGVDSASVLGIARRLSPKTTAAFTVAFDHPQFDESSAARGMAAHAGVDFHPIRVTGADFADVFEQTVASAEGPLINGHGPARYILSREVRRAGFKVVLGGEGADELFAGYEFTRAALATSLSAGFSPAWLAKRVRRARRMDVSLLKPVSPLLALACRVLGVEEHLLASLSEKLGQWRRLLNPDFLARHAGRDPYREFAGELEWRRLIGREPSKVVLAIWMKSHFPNYVLAGERLDMANAVEVRLPFLDHRLFEYVRHLPASLLYKGGQNKHVLRQAVAPYVTPEVLSGQKWPFFAPPTSLAPGNPLAGLLRELILGEDFRSLPFFDHRQIRTFLDGWSALPAGERDSRDPLVYLLASFAVLQRRYRPAAT